MKFQVIVLNLANCDNDPNWPARKEIIRAELDRLQVDAALLQEVRYDPVRCGPLDMGSELAAALDMQCNLAIAQYYDPITLEPTDHVTTVWEGLAILTKTRPTTDTYLNLDKPILSQDKNHRISQRVDLSLSLINLHFSTDPLELAENVQQTVNWLDLLDPINWLNVDPPHCVFAGDFNASPPTVSALLSTTNLIDAWHAWDPTDRGYTFPSSKPTDRIDYLWIDPKLVPKLSNIQLLFAQPVNGIYASDHLGILAEFDL